MFSMPQRHCFVYIVRCADGSLFTGVADEPERAAAHLNAGGGSAYVRARLPVFLAYTEEYMNERDAERRAAAVRRLSRENKERLLAYAPAAAMAEIVFA
jgi:predicted GIY-YIG superfamily endonuclease